MMKVLVLWMCFLHTVGALSGSPPQRASAQLHTELHAGDSWNQGKPRTLFARRGVVAYQRLRATKLHMEALPVAPRCARATESCFPHSRCCDPCASCHCRFFNVVCYCWRLGHHCQMKT